MNWYEKEPAYDKAYRAGKVSRDIYKYIPRKLSEAIDDCVIDPDGYWVYLNPGWSAYDHDVDCRIIHEYSIADLKQAIKTIAKDPVPA